MNRREYGIGIIGLGCIAEVHLEGYRKANLKVVGGAEIDEKRLKEMKETWQLPFTTTNYQELIEHPDVRIVDVTVPPIFELRLNIIEYAAKKGKALFIQKPLAYHFEHAKQLVDTADRYGVPLMVNQNSLFVPAFLAMKKYLENGSIGKPYYCQIENRKWFDFSEHPWQGKKKRYYTIEMGIHHWALISHWFGKWKSVYAMMGRDPSQLKIIGENWSVVCVRFDSGVRALVINNCTYRGEQVKPHPREEIIIQGDKGCIAGNSEEICIVTTDPPARIYPNFEGKWFPDAFGNAMCHFIDALSAGKSFLCSGLDNLNAIGIAEAAYISAEAQREVLFSEVLKN